MVGARVRLHFYIDLLGNITLANICMQISQWPIFACKYHTGQYMLANINIVNIVKYQTLLLLFHIDNQRIKSVIYKAFPPGDNLDLVVIKILRVEKEADEGGTLHAMANKTFVITSILVSDMCKITSIKP